MASFVDQSTDCAICLNPLDEDGKPVITLRCGHRFYLECIKEQIKNGCMTANNDDKRLLFNGCQCPKCKRVFGEDDHPDLPKDLIRKTDQLRSKVETLIDEHNLLDKTSVPIYEEALRRYAFYLCDHCRDPYFGGTIDCADSVAPSSSSSGPDTRLCPACAPQSQTVCQNPTEHGACLVWKCRYCCKPSTKVCYGNVHFCDDCHKKNSKKGRDSLKAVPCPGGSCPYPKPAAGSPEHGTHRFHCNGPTQDCEQVYFCAICDSIDNGNHDSLAIEPGSRNFLVNPSGEDGLEGWRVLYPYMSWKVEDDNRGNQIIPPLSQTPVLGRTGPRLPITTNFVSSYQNCAMVQTVDLGEVLRFEPNNGVVRIEISARFTGRTDCPSVFNLQAILSDGDLTTRLQRPPDPRAQMSSRAIQSNDLPAQVLSSGTLNAPPGVYWERTSLELSFDANTHGRNWERPMVTVIVIGRDQRFWQGNYGSKVADITVRVVGRTLEEIDSLLKPSSGGGRPQIVAAATNVAGVSWARIAVFGVVVSLFFSYMS